ncbi:hypothetical protein QVD17_07770 [Tagetes erecta]|uniref:Uncharacterized protein n=1 Tax=Tagetes erecta TaxID=13708 RepID=A0AAD8P2S7_TARER|nr:hypothetical protein QVD17_07770 [Tagetes erecta]
MVILFLDLSVFASTIYCAMCGLYIPGINYKETLLFFIQIESHTIFENSLLLQSMKITQNINYNIHSYQNL